MEGRLVPVIVVLALGAGTLGGPDALRALLDIAGRSPVLDIAACVLLMGMFAAQLLGAVLLARFVRDPPPRRAQAQAGGTRGGGAPRRPGAPAADCFAKLALTVSAGVAFSVAACIAFLSGGGLMSPARLAFHFAGTRPVVVSAAGVLLLCFTPLLRVLRAAGNGGAPALRATATRTRTFCIAALPLAGICLVFARSVARGGLDALCRSSAGSITTFAGVGAVLLLARFSRRAGNGAGTALGALDALRHSSAGSITGVATFAFAVVGVVFLLSRFSRRAGNGSGTAPACSGFRWPCRFRW